MISLLPAVKSRMISNLLVFGGVQNLPRIYGWITRNIGLYKFGNFEYLFIIFSIFSTYHFYVFSERQHYTVIRCVDSVCWKIGVGFLLSGGNKM